MGSGTARSLCVHMGHLRYHTSMSEILEPTDEEIAERVRSGDRDAYALLLNRYKDKLLRYVTSIVRDSDQASHIVQDSLVKAYINLNGFNTKKKFSSWLYRIAHNESMNALKKYKKEVPLPDGFDFESEEDITKEFEEKETALYVEKCLDALPVLYSEPLSLYYLDGKSYEDISEILKIPKGTTATRIRKAKKLLKHLCQKI